MKRSGLLTTFPKRLHGARVAVLAATASDQPRLRNSAEHRRWARAVAPLRPGRICRVQLRSRDGAEPFLASADVAIDQRARIRAVFAANALVRALLPGALRERRGLRFIGARAARRGGLVLRHETIELPAIDRAALLERGFTGQLEPRELHHVGDDRHGRPMLLAPAAAAAWTQMRRRAASDNIVLEPVSSFRSVAYQRGLIARKLKRGDTLEQILSVNAAPGYSEHHSGHAIDIGTPGCPALDEAFEQTPAFAWLVQHAPDFGFRLSYPRNNTLGVIYEPWHWSYVGAPA